MFKLPPPCAAPAVKRIAFSSSVDSLSVIVRVVASVARSIVMLLGTCPFVTAPPMF